MVVPQATIENSSESVEVKTVVKEVYLFEGLGKEKTKLPVPSGEIWLTAGSYKFLLATSTLPVPVGTKLMLLFGASAEIVIAPVLPKILSEITFAVAVTFAFAVILAFATIDPVELIETNSTFARPLL